MDFRSATCVKKDKTILPNTNSRYPTFHQPIFTAGDIEQFNSQRTRLSLEIGPENEELEENQFKDTTLVIPWKGYFMLDSRAVANTFNYLFFKFKKGIFVKIHDNKLRSFIPFSNVAFSNEWHTKIKVEEKYGNIQDFLNYVSKLSGYKKSQKAIPIEKWYANNSIVRYEDNDFDIGHNITVLFDMYKTLCEKRTIADVEFFVNRRDNPLLTRDGTEPYDHLYGSEHTKLLSHDYDKYSPILSFSTTPRFADVLSPTYEDWARVVYQEDGQGIEYDCKTYPKIISIPWQDKVKKAVFRGSTTGQGVTAETNQRLKALEIGEKRRDILDVGITKWNLRPRKLKDQQYLKTIERDSYPLAKHLSPQQQSDYAYILNIEGHVSAYRLSYEMSFGSVILLVKSKWSMWITKFLEPYVHYVPVEEDLSDLTEKIEWCINNDEKCQEIAQNSLQFYDDFLKMDSILDYLQKVLFELAEMMGKYDYLKELLSEQLIYEENWFKTYVTKMIADRQLNVPPKFYPAPIRRCIGLLDGQWLGIQAVDPSTVTKVGTLFRSRNSVVDVVNVGPIRLVAKVSLSSLKQKENIHEAFIGTTVTNKLVAKVPNFAYVFGHLHENLPYEETVFKLPFRSNPPISMYTQVLYTEHIDGINMNEWIRTSFDWGTYLKILIQLCLALKVAQDESGFMHYDLVPGNIIIRRNSYLSTYYYKVKPGTTLNISTDVIPIMIDFGKSRAVVKHEKYGLVDHGFSNMYEASAIYDVMTLLLSTLHTINLTHNLDPQKMHDMTEYFGMIGGQKFIEQIDKYKKFGALFGKTVEMTSNPLSLVNFLVKKYGPFDYLKLARDYKNEMALGNPLNTYYQMQLGDEHEALAATVKTIDESTFARSANGLLQQIIIKIMREKTGWLTNEINIKGDETLKYHWSKLFETMLQMPKATAKIDLKFPTPKLVYLDSEITPSYVEELSTKIPPVIPEDWGLIRTMLIDAGIGGETVEQLININVFEFLNAVASVNTLHMLKNENLG
jgi:hypothetical protein